MKLTFNTFVVSFFPPRAASEQFPSFANFSHFPPKTIKNQTQAVQSNHIAQTNVLGELASNSDNSLSSHSIYMSITGNIYHTVL